MLHLKCFFLLCLLFGLSACRQKSEVGTKQQKESEEYFTSPPTPVAELSKNRLANEPTDFLRRQADSKIHWQPWSREVLALAERSQRLIFVFVGSSTHSLSQPVLDILARDAATELNEKYLCTIADSESDPALALACYQLANEIRVPIAFPYLMWLSHEGNPIAWIPLTTSEESSFLPQFRQAQTTIETVLAKSPRYVVENSRYDNENRKKRIKEGLTPSPEALVQKDTALSRNLLFQAAQELADLYDELNQSFDSTGGIPPGHLITTLARIGQHPACPPRLKKSAFQATRDSIQLLTQSAIRDPLDGYFFVRRASNTFAIPILIKKLETQAELLSAMSSSPPTPASQKAIAQLLTALSETPFQDHALSPTENENIGYFWSTNQLQNVLSQEELSVAKAAFNLRPLGNIPSQDDPQRLFFRKNSLGLAKFGEALAQSSNQNPAEAEALLQSAQQKILAHRQELAASADNVLSEKTPFLSTQARLLTALVRTQASNPQPATLELLTRTGEGILSNFRDSEGKLLRIPAQEGQRPTPGFGSDYALTIDALLEWYRLTWNPSTLQTATALATHLLDDFTTPENWLVERQVEDQVLTFPIYSESMVFGPSTWGTGYGVLARLQALGFRHPKLEPVLDHLAQTLSILLKNLPVVHTDYLASAFNTIDELVLLLSPETTTQGESLRLALAQPEFDSLAISVAEASLKNLVDLKGQAAVLLKSGEPVTTFANVSEILPGLRFVLSH